MVTEPPAKRRREDEPADEGAPTISLNWTRHPELWLDRGDIILVCDNTGFRVGQCVLSLNSPVFREMFGMVDPAQNETFDGIPIARLHDDAEEMYHLLKAMHVRQYVRKTSKPTFKSLASILKLSTKYMVDGLREEIIDILTGIYPSTMSAMANRFSGYIPDDLDTLYAVELAKQCDVPIILPAACFISSLQPIKTIMDSEASVASVATRCTCAIFRDQLMTFVDSTTRRDRDTNSSLFKASLRDSGGGWTCAGDKCFSTNGAWIEDIEVRARRLTEKNLFSPTLGRLTGPNRSCDALKRRFDQHWDGIQRKIWDALPSLCGFENWAAINTAHTASSAAEDQAKPPAS